MIVVYSASRNLYPYLHPSIYSLVEHNDVEKIYLLLEDATYPEYLPKLPDCCEVIDVSNQKFFDKSGPNFRTKFTYLSLMRVCYTKLFPNLDKILQLDVDTIVTDSLEDLWNTDISDSYFAAVPERLSEWNPYDCETYYNVGVCLFNLKKLREDKMDDKLINFLDNFWAKYIDQDAVNKFCSDEAVELPVRFNETFVTGYTSNPAIVHFAGKSRWYLCSEDMHRYEYLKKYMDPKILENS